MEKESILESRLVAIVCDLLDECSKSSNVSILSVLLYGSKARGERSGQNEYEFMVLLEDETGLPSYINFNNMIRFELMKRKLIHANVVTYTPQVFENLLFNDPIIGAFLFIICKDHILIMDRMGTFTAIKEKVAAGTHKTEETFLEQCVHFSKVMGSLKWQQKWEKTLMQYKYMKKRKNGVV